MTFWEMISEHSHLFIYIAGIIFAAGGFVLLTRKKTEETSIKIDKALDQMGSFQDKILGQMDSLENKMLNKVDELKNSVHSVQLEQAKQGAQLELVKRQHEKDK